MYHTEVLPAETVASEPSNGDHVRVGATKADRRRKGQSPYLGFAKADIPMSQVETVDELVAKMKEAGVIA